MTWWNPGTWFNESEAVELSEAEQRYNTQLKYVAMR